MKLSIDITDDIKYVGVDDHDVDIFEGQFAVKNGMSYNSYVVLDERITVLDTVDERFGDQWLKNVKAVLGDRKPSYLIVQHMEPDHSANVALFMSEFPEATVIASAHAFVIMKNLFGTDWENRHVIIQEGSTLTTGRHTFAFVAAPMVHWPEVMVTYDTTEKALFSADGFGTFGANDLIGRRGWDDEARRYYIGIVGKYGKPVQDLLKKAGNLDIHKILPLHGPLHTTADQIGHVVGLYDTWSSYHPETKGVFIAYTSVYGHTRAAVERLAWRLREKGCHNVKTADLSRDDLHGAVADAFRFSHIVLATTTYNGDIFPLMKNFINNLVDRNFQNRTVAIIENGSWMATAGLLMRNMFKSSQAIRICENTVTILSSMDAGSTGQIEALADELCS